MMRHLRSTAAAGVGGETDTTAAGTAPGRAPALATAADADAAARGWAKSSVANR